MPGVSTYSAVQICGATSLKIAATTVPRFTAGAGFKAAVAGKKAAKKK
jgi:nucleoid DNA-binding protein